MSEARCETCMHFAVWKVTKAFEAHYSKNPKPGTCTYPVTLPKKRPYWFRANGMVTEISGEKCKTWAPISQPKEQQP